MIVKACITKNFGDTLNYEFVKHISGVEPTIVNNSFNNIKKHTIYMAIGSILGWADINTVVWGSGFLFPSQIIDHPKKICAVRGHLTRDRLLRQRITCPDVFGDPVLLMPMFYKPNFTKKYKMSIVLHHVDKPHEKELQKLYPDAHFIDIQGDVYDVIDDICASEKVMSSALHGLICADAYDIPNVWFKISDNVLGNGFKFYDYFSSTMREDQKMFDVTLTNDINAKFNAYQKININLDKLLNACPFKRK